MSEALRLAAWLTAHAKFMKYEEERIEMMKAARMLRSFENEINSNLEALRKARDLLSEMRKMIEDVSK